MSKEATSIESNVTRREPTLREKRKEMLKAVDVSFIKLMKAMEAYSNDNLTKAKVKKLLQENQLNLEGHGSK